MRSTERTLEREEMSTRRWDGRGRVEFVEPWVMRKGSPRSKKVFTAEAIFVTACLWRSMVGEVVGDREGAWVGG